MIRYKCMKCGALLESRSSMAGREDQCPVCHQVCIVPARKNSPYLILGLCGAAVLIVIMVLAALHLSSQRSPTEVSSRELQENGTDSVPISADVTTDTQSPSEVSSQELLTGNSEPVRTTLTGFSLVSGVTVSEGVKILELVEAPLVIWIEGSDGIAYETTLEFTPEDLTTIEPLLKTASEVHLVGVEGGAWESFKNVELDTETSVPALELVAEAMDLAPSDKVDLNIASGFGVCLICRPAGTPKWLDLWEPE